MTAAAQGGAADGFAVVLGRCDDMRAEVFVRYAPTSGGDVVDVQLVGAVIGPRRGRDVILPVTMRLAAVAGGDAGRPPLARAILTEPAFWTPELPNLYRLEAKAVRHGAEVAAIDRLVGLRRSGARGRSLWLEGRRWVPRAAVQPEGVAFEGGVLHAAGLTVAVEDPSEILCSRADEAGVAILAVLAEATAANPVAAAARIATWAWHPSVVAVVVPRSAPAAAIAAEARGVKGTMLVAHVADGLAPPPPVPPGIDALLVGLPAGGLPHATWREAPPAIPLLAWRGDAVGPTEPRRACDQLQAALAGWGVAGGAERLAWDWAGYIVGAVPEVR